MKKKILKLYKHGMKVLEISTLLKMYYHHVELAIRWKNKRKCAYCKSKTKSVDHLYCSMYCKSTGGTKTCTVCKKRMPSNKRKYCSDLCRRVAYRKQ